MPGAAVPDHLQRHGVPLVLGPLRTGAEVGLSAAQWRRLGQAVARVHAVPVAPLAGLAGRERFRPSRRELLPDLDALVAAAGVDDPVAARLAACWRAHRDAIDALVDRADRLGREVARRRSPQVLCHGDLHRWNVLVEADGRLWMMDWDEAVVAPRERDLFFVVGGIGHGLVGPGDTASFLQALG